MVAEELSQNEIDSLFDNGETEEKKEEEITPEINKIFTLLNASIEEVFKTAFSLEVVSKFIGLSVDTRDNISLEDKVSITGTISTQEKSADLSIFVDKRFASILADLMLMGPGEAKEKLEPDDLDALKELFSQVFGNLSTAVKDSVATPLTFEIKEVKEETTDLPELLYKATYDIALPNIEDGTIEVLTDKPTLDSFFEKQEEQEAEQPQEVPFKDVEEQEPVFEEKPRISKQPETPKNLDLIMDIDLDVKIRIGEKYMLIKDILDLKDGSIIELDKSIEEPMDILVNGKVVAKGVVVVVGGRFGIKITHIETREERIKSLGG